MRTIIAIVASLLALSCAPENQAPPGSETDRPQAIEQPTILVHDAALPPTGDVGSTTATSSFARGQTLYVPVYSHVYYGHDKRTFNLACTLCIRNIDASSSITLTTIDYYNTKGAFVRAFFDEPRILMPLETVDFYIQERDTSGGSGANFIVRWGSDTAVDAPIVEAVMIGVADGQGISFVSPSREITE